MRRRTPLTPVWLGKLLRNDRGEPPQTEPELGIARARSEERKPSPSGPVPKPKLARILIIDDEPHVAMAIRRLLHRHDVAIAHSGTQALALLRSRPFDAVVSDVMMPEPAGLDVYELLAREGSPLVRRFVFVTGGVYGRRAHDFLARIPNQRLDKPVDPIALHLALARVMHEPEPVAQVDAG